jgi:hypothetical protein
MGITRNRNPESQPELDRKAEGAARKVRRMAEISSSDQHNESERIATDSEIFEAHAELERPEHYKGHPLPQHPNQGVQSWRVAHVTLEARCAGFEVVDTVIVACETLSLHPPVTPKTGASGTSAMNIAPARIVALGVECGTIRSLGWMPDLTHLLFKDAMTGEQKEFCVKLDSLAGSAASFIVR